ncbi:unnamed protein product [Spirodela intermedia]|uniref:Uncharacterized protein n=1 Tax=Spirodela intermedia TaxID=51605 RepID=A0A7I8JLD9_SPIIN|nr:unnamed protein product [Spirodela intermedia]CAA6670292.1 unnamed protein product [Spirodela intermedia]
MLQAMLSVSPFTEFHPLRYVERENSRAFTMMGVRSFQSTIRYVDGERHLPRSAATIAAQHSPTAQQHSTWRSPVPYLFGGLAAMLGLIAGSDTQSGDAKGEDGDAAKATWAPREQRIVVIMAGNEKPSFLATPLSGGASYFGDCSGTEKVGVAEKEVEDWTKRMTGNRDYGDSEAVQVGNEFSHPFFLLPIGFSGFPFLSLSASASSSSRYIR